MEVEDDTDAKKMITLDNPAYATWIAWDQQVLRFLLNTLSSDILADVLGLESSAEVWAAITAMFSYQNKQRI
jgi:hypothetical protein